MEIVITLFVALLGLFGYKIATRKRQKPDPAEAKTDADPVALELERAERESRDTDDRIERMHRRATDTEPIDTSKGADPSAVRRLRALRDSRD